MGIISLSQFGLRLQNFLTPNVGARSALPERQNQDLFNVKLEGRLDNYKRGQTAPGDVGVDVEISTRSALVSDALATQDPTALKNYNSFLSGFTYSRSARMVTNVEYAVRKMSQIPTEAEAKAQTDQVLKAFNLGATDAATEGSTERS